MEDNNTIVIDDTKKPNIIKRTGAFIKKNWKSGLILAGSGVALAALSYSKGKSDERDEWGRLYDEGQIQILSFEEKALTAGDDASDESTTDELSEETE